MSDPWDELIDAPSPRHIEVPDGTYTVEYPDHWVTLRVRTQPESAAFKPGSTLVAYLYGPDNERDFRTFGEVCPTTGRLKVWQKQRATLLKGKPLEEHVFALLRSPKNAARTYGVRSGRYGICGRTLTVPESIQQGIGPVCAGRTGY